jgi:cysteine-rich repeat protein
MRDSMIRSWPAALLRAAAALALLGDAPGLAQGARVTLCHFPPGNPTHMRTIEVGEPAVGAHLAHGDALGACPNGLGECGNGVVEGSEGCDAPDFADRTCVDVLGEGATGAPACTESCELAPGSCQLCGNAIREGTEECDDGNADPVDGCNNQCVIVEDQQD